MGILTAGTEGGTEKRPLDLSERYQLLIAVYGGERGIRTLDGLFKPILP
jgi:hypothetical protein